MIRFALFGCGRIGRVHADSIDVHPRAELAWVYDPIESAALEVAKRYGTATASTVDAAIDDPSVDAVVIASATPTHVDLLTRAVRAGKAVLCEKPIDLGLARVDRCWTDIAALNPTVLVGFNRRFDPSFREAHDRIAAGAIGRLEQLTIVSRDPAPASRDYLAVSGGLFRDMTIHDFDLARFYLGEVVEVYAAGANLVADYIAELGDIDSAVVVMRGADGALCQITNSRRSVFGYDQRLEAFGSEGMLSVGNQHPTSVRQFNASQTEAANEYLNFFLDRYTPAYRAELDHLITAMEQGSQPSPGFADGREALALADAALASFQTGRTVRLGPPWALCAPSSWSRRDRRQALCVALLGEEIPMSTHLLEGKIILVSGGTRGLGAGIARAAAAEGATGIMITGRDRAAGEAFAAELSGNGTDISFHAVDLADPLAAAGSVGATVASYGRIDCVVNSAGITTRGTLLWDQNVLGPHD